MRNYFKAVYRQVSGVKSVEVFFEDSNPEDTSEAYKTIKAHASLYDGTISVWRRPRAPMESVVGKIMARRFGQIRMMPLVGTVDPWVAMALFHQVRGQSEAA